MDQLQFPMLQVSLQAKSGIKFCSKSEVHQFFPEMKFHDLVKRERCFSRASADIAGHGLRFRVMIQVLKLIVNFQD